MMSFMKVVKFVAIISRNNILSNIIFHTMILTAAKPLAKGISEESTQWYDAVLSFFSILIVYQLASQISNLNLFLLGCSIAYEI